MRPTPRRRRAAHDHRAGSAGGGQPDDRGTINGAEVLRVERRGATVVIADRDGSEISCEADTQQDAVEGMIHRLSAMLEGGMHNVSEEGTCKDCGN